MMAWGGASITDALGLTGWRQADVALFAIGIILLARVPYSPFRARGSEPDARLTNSISTPSAS